MRLRFLTIDPDTGGDHCPAFFIDEDTGDLVFQGEAVTDRSDLDQIEAHSRMAGAETAVRLPARMAHRILEALDGIDPPVR
ncbi:hypothetical protein J0910_17670 [Nocardiopsis sp. CNT-189]|uniref:hypothetical protein n=1 Tax=Nocardiopsis oceanisediminis TaxID=2816862 RepID=UPI003B2E9FFA